MENKELNLNVENEMSIYERGLDFASEGDDNSAIRCYLKGVEQGDERSCIEMCLTIKYPNQKYEYDEIAIEALQDDNFGYYLDVGIKNGSLHCLYYKSLEQFMGDGYLKLNLRSALKGFKTLKAANYDTRSYFDDDWSVDEYISLIEKDIKYNKTKNIQKLSSIFMNKYNRFEKRVFKLFGESFKGHAVIEYVDKLSELDKDNKYIDMISNCRNYRNIIAHSADVVDKISISKLKKCIKYLSELEEVNLSKLIKQ